MPQPGDTAPDFTIPGETGPISLTDFAGRKLVVYFYPKDDTPGCTTQAREFSALKAQFAAADTVVIGVSHDSLASHAKFRGKHGLEIALGADDGTVTAAFGVWVEKAMYGKKYMGIERSTFLIGRDGKVAATWPKVKAAGHAALVLAAAQALA
ncbi:peroxiredoxin [Sandarakinorhabdus sp.]|uniref:peroxiredoxin n=1 Tax=Sandarakinorhabdus sp. TaxID=1916663 RepID=UPI0038F62B4D